MNSESGERSSYESGDLLTLLSKKGTRFTITIKDENSANDVKLLEGYFCNIYKDLITKVLHLENPNAKHKHASALHQLCANPENSVIVESLLETGLINVNVVDRNMKSALHVAVTEGCNEIVNLLLSSNNINVNACDHLGKTALHYSLRDEKMLKMLLKHRKVDVMVQDSSKRTVLHYYCTSGKVPSKEVVKMMVEKNSNILSVRDEEGKIAYNIAATRHGRLSFLDAEPRDDVNNDNDQYSLLSKLINAGCDSIEYELHKAFNGIQTAEHLLYATHLLQKAFLKYPQAKPSYFKVIKWLTERFPTLCNHRYDKNMSILHIACDRKYHQITDMLLKYKSPDIYAKCNDNRTPIHYAIRSQSMKIFKQLVPLISLEKMIDDKGRNILHHCFELKSGRKKISMFNTIAGKHFDWRMLKKKDNKNLSPLQYIKLKQDWSLLVEIGNKVGHDSLKISDLKLHQINDLAATLNANSHSEPPWKQVCRKLKDLKIKITDVEIEFISNSVDFQKGMLLIGHLEVSMKEGSDISAVAEHVGNKMVVTLLEGVCNFNRLDRQTKEELALYFGNDKSLRYELYKEFQLSNNSIRRIEHPCQTNSTESPTERLFSILETKCPDFKMSDLFKVLKDLSLMNTVNALGVIVHDIITCALEVRILQALTNHVNGVQ